MLCVMEGASQLSLSADTASQIRRIQTITIIWMGAEAALSLWAAWAAHSPALVAFGGDSFIELFSATLVLLRFTVRWNGQSAERRASVIAGVLLLALAAFVTGASVITLFGRIEPRPTRVGIAVLIAAAAFMPLLAKRKRTLAVATDSAALRADAAESAACGYLAIFALVGLILNAVWHLSWADPVAALCLLPFIGREGWEAIRAKRVCG